MKYLLNFLEKNVRWLIILFCLLALALHLQKNDFPPFNSDEASFAYNAYSIAQTGKDEYGVFMPSRFKAFGENKLPVTIYLISPFVKLLGLTEFASRLPFVLIGIISPLLFYFLTKKLFNNTVVALIASFLASVSPWIQIMSRHIHENIIILVLMILALWILLKLMDKISYKNILVLSIINGISLFTYHIGKLLAIYFFVALIVILLKQRKKMSEFFKIGLIFFIPIVIFLFTEFLNPTTRVNNLLFINNEGFTASIEELRKEHDIRLLHNKVTQSVITLTQRYLTYFSPEFLVIKGDANDRFGFPGISPISAIEYALIFVGIYFLFKNNERYKYLIISVLFVAPLTASLSWQDYSITRSFLMIIPLLILASYGFYNITTNQTIKFAFILMLLIIVGHGYFSFYSWDFYFNHYPQRKEAIYAWQGGYKELNAFIKENYNVYNTFYITKKLGQPYIFTLFYLQYPPEKYQQQAHLSEPGEYGFGEVEQFDKFIFHFKNPPAQYDNSVYIGYPEDFQGTGISDQDVKRITYKGQELFWIYTGVIE